MRDVEPTRSLKINERGDMGTILKHTRDHANIYR